MFVRGKKFSRGSQRVNMFPERKNFFEVFGALRGTKNFWIYKALLV
jgi:hypothetical protein